MWIVNWSDDESRVNIVIVGIDGKRIRRKNDRVDLRDRKVKRKPNQV